MVPNLSCTLESLQRFCYNFSGHEMSKNSLVSPACGRGEACQAGMSWGLTGYQLHGQGILISVPCQPLPMRPLVLLAEV